MEELYTLEREVGRGSYGVVFEGHVAKTGQRVAIKRLSCRNPECIELYLQELWAMRATAKNHVNVIALHSCLLQTGPRSLKPLRPGRLPPRLVESVLKGSVGRAAHSRDGNVAQRRSSQDRNVTQRRSSQDGNVAQRRSSQDGNVTQRRSSQDGNVAQSRSSQDGNVAQRRSSQDGNVAQRRSSQDGNVAQRRSSQDGNVTQRRSSQDGNVTQRRSSQDGNIAQRSSSQDGNVAQRRSSSVPKLQDRTNTAHNRLTLQDRVKPNESTTPQRPQNRSRKRPAPGEEDRPGPPRCLALWLVMEFCDGGDLNQYLLSRPPDAQQNHSVVLQLCSAVAFLHGRGITHRDLKPDNVLVCETAGGPVVKVADFGLSKVSGGEVDGGPARQHFSSTCGSDFFMAPEVWGGLSYTAQADIFSLGVMFWAVLERITLLEEGSTHEQLGAYVVKGRSGWLVPLGEALWDNADLQLCIPMKSRRAPPLPPPPGPALCALLSDMLASDPDARPAAAQLESRVCRALEEDAC